MAAAPHPLGISVSCDLITPHTEYRNLASPIIRSAAVSTASGICHNVTASCRYHPSSGAQTAVCTASGICHTVTATGRYHPSTGAQTAVSTASGICHTVTATCRYHPSSGAQTAVSTVSGICHTVMDRVKLLIQCTRRYKNTVWLQSSCTRHLNHTVIERPKVVKLKLQLLLIMYFCGKCSMFCLIMLDIHNVTATCRYRLRNMLSSFQIK